MDRTDARLAADLPGVVERGELHILYQPQVDLGSRKIVAVEALCRWQHPLLGLLMPSTFIPIAERTGAIGKLGRFMVEHALVAADRWRRAGHPLEMSVNVSPLQLTTTAFHHMLAREVGHRALPRDGLTIEITESRPVLEVAQVVSWLKRMRAGGLGVSLDDYGTGHSSLEQFQSLPASELKIDKLLVQDDGAVASAQIEQIVALAHDRGVRVVAEGVETESQYERMRSMGCDRAQGYLLGRPMSSLELDALLAA
jgi:EAL domain-containing protein (putative c-di-GMP-specific phosphodiesterase class I)